VLPIVERMLPYKEVVSFVLNHVTLRCFVIVTSLCVSRDRPSFLNGAKVAPRLKVKDSPCPPHSASPDKLVCHSWSRWSLQLTECHAITDSSLRAAPASEQQSGRRGQRVLSSSAAERCSSNKRALFLCPPAP